MFKKLGRKIIEDSRRKQPARALVVPENDDSFIRYEGGSLCERGDDVYYHGGHDHGHDHDDGLTED